MTRKVRKQPRRKLRCSVKLTIALLVAMGLGSILLNVLEDPIVQVAHAIVDDGGDGAI